MDSVVGIVKRGVGGDVWSPGDGWRAEGTEVALVRTCFAHGICSMALEMFGVRCKCGPGGRKEGSGRGQDGMASVGGERVMGEAAMG